MVIAGCTVAIAAATIGRRAELPPPVFALVFDEVSSGAVVDAPGWRTDGRLRRTLGGRTETYNRWVLAGPPDVSFDGSRVLFAARSAAGTGIWEMPSDGTGARQLFACASGCAAPRYLPDGRLVFAAAVGTPGEEGIEALFTSDRDGAGLDRITYGRGRDRAIDVLPDGRIAFLRRLLDRQQPTGGAAALFTVQPDGTGVALASQALAADVATVRVLWSTPADLSQGAPGTADVRAASLERATGDAHAEIAIAAAPRAAPPVATSVVDRARDTGKLLCLDTWLTTRDGRPYRQRRTGGRVRVIDAELDVVLGEVPVASDGSFYVEVPANRTLRLHAVDDSGTLVSALDSGIWVRPNEQRACIGCHEPASLAPANKYPEALHAPPAAALGRPRPTSAARMEAASRHE